MVKETADQIMEQVEIDDEITEEIEEDLKEDAIEEDIDIQTDLQDLEPGVIPHQEENHNLLKFLKEDVLNSPNRFMTAYLTWEELGKPTFSTRFWLNLSNTCDNLFGFSIVGEYCRTKARVTTDTSLSRDGFIIGTTVTQRKLKEKKSSSELAKYLKDKK